MWTTTAILFLSAFLVAESGIFDIVDKVLPITTTFYREKNGHRMVEIIEVNTYIGGKKLVDCYLYGHLYIIDKMMELVPSDIVKYVNKKEMSKLVNTCSNLHVKNLREEVFNIIKTPFDFARKLFKSLLIFPGTKWCGAGDVADDYDDLGIYEKTDKCCRTHDHCNDSIVGFETKYDLKNKDFYTKSSCSCDLRFHSCLYKKEAIHSDAVGHLFFNILQTQCFKDEYPIVKCLKKWGIPLIRETCQKYKLDYNGTKKYQFFDAKMYKGKNESPFLKKLLSH
uniref:Phospholipase A2 n=1 Tax=Hadrurus spadix TaxID=141984 RepID=A0A1W7RA16_9SCOR